MLKVKKHKFWCTWPKPAVEVSFPLGNTMVFMLFMLFYLM